MKEWIQCRTRPCLAPRDRHIWTCARMRVIGRGLYGRLWETKSDHHMHKTSCQYYFQPSLSAVPLQPALIANVWPALTKGGQSRWEDHEITGGKHQPRGSFCEFVVFDFFFGWHCRAFIWSLFLLRTSHFDLKWLKKNYFKWLKLCESFQLHFLEFNGHSDSCHIPYSKRPKTSKTSQTL